MKIGKKCIHKEIEGHTSLLPFISFDLTICLLFIIVCVVLHKSEEEHQVKWALNYLNGMLQRFVIDTPKPIFTPFLILTPKQIRKLYHVHLSLMRICKFPSHRWQTCSDIKYGLHLILSALIPHIY